MNGLSTRFDRTDRTTTLALVLVALVLLSAVPATAVAGADDATETLGVTIDGTNSPVTEGDTLRVKATIGNNGRKTVRDTHALTVGGEQRDAAEVELGGGENTTVTLAWATGEGDGGTYEATVATANDSDTTDVRVREPTQFAVDIEKTTSPVTEGDDLDVDVVVSNVGDLPGNKTVTLSIGAARADSTNVALDAGENQTVTLTWATGEGDAGNYSAVVATDDDSAERAVKVREETANDPPTVRAIEFIPCDPDCDGDPVAVAGGQSSYEDLKMIRGAKQNATMLVPNTSDPDGAVASYAWRVDGEVVSESRTLTYTFDEAGEHELALTVTDDDGASATARVALTVEDGNEPPTVSIGGITNNTMRNSSLTFTADAEDPDGNITTYVWTVDGQVVSREPTMAYTFEEPGEHEVALRVTDDDGATTTETVTVTVESANEPPEVSVQVDPSSPTVGESVTVDAEASDPDGSIDSYRLDVDGDGEYENRSSEATHTFREPGEHEVTVQVTDDDGETTTETRVVTVNAPPEVSIDTPGDVGAGETVTFSADSSDPDGDDDALTYEWTVDGDPAGSGSSLEHAFESRGEHEVTLRVTDDDGATATVTRTIQVSAAGTATSPDEATPIDVGSPGFGPLAALAALGGAALLGRRRW